MRILWVKMGGLWPATSGGRVRSLQMLSHLSARHQVTVITTHGPGDDPVGLAGELPHCRRIVSIDYAAPKFGSAAFVRTMARSWFSSYPVDLWKWRLRAMPDHVSSLLDADSIDLCVADFLVAMPNVPERQHVPVVLFEHNVEHRIWRRLATVEPQVARKALLEMEWRKVRRCEAAACSSADMTIAVSDEDRRALSALARDAVIKSVPTGVDSQYFTPGRRPEVPARLVFTGSMDWHPNEDAVLYFAETILPRIRADIPQVSFTVVGRNPSSRVAALGRLGVTVTGSVADVRPFMDEAAVYVVPLRAGSGTRLKIFEAMAMAKAVVSTTIGAEGLGVTPAREIVLADDVDAFARAVTTLLRNPLERQRLGRAARALVESTYSWEHAARVFEGHCETVVAHARWQSSEHRVPAAVLNGREPV
jgi:sugar transferase (PEP-CTERM/EpsH1 system associated)